MRRYRALGRLKQGEMNKTEAAYAQHLEAQKLAGEVLWYRFEAIKLRISDGSFYSPDFAVLLANGELEMHETKGKTRKTASDGTKYDKAFTQDDAVVKIKAASELFPCAFKLAYPRTGGGWNVEEM